MNISRFFRRGLIVAAATLCALAAHEGRAGQFTFNGAPDNHTDALDYYYGITVEKFPT